jgi:hypothetical protein
MKLSKLENLVETKKAEGKRVALYDGTEIHLKGTIAVVDYESGFRYIIDETIGDYLNWTPEDITSWNVAHGIDKKTMDRIVDQSMRSF